MSIYITRTDTWHGMLSGKLRKNCLSQKLVIPFHVTKYHEIEIVSMETNVPLVAGCMIQWWPRTTKEVKEERALQCTDIMQSNGQAAVANGIPNSGLCCNGWRGLTWILFYGVLISSWWCVSKSHLHSEPWPSQIRKLEVMRLSTDLGPLTNQIIKSLQRFLLRKKCCETDGNWGDNYPSAEIKTPLKPSAGLLDNNAWAVGRPNLSISPGKKETWSSGMYMFVGLIQTNSNEKTCQSRRVWYSKPVSHTDL